VIAGIEVLNPAEGMVVKSLVFVVSCVVSGLCDELIACLEETYRLCDLEMPESGCGVGQSWALAPRKNKS
jgi:hypothetical protein